MISFTPWIPSRGILYPKKLYLQGLRRDLLREYASSSQYFNLPKILFSSYQSTKSSCFRPSNFSKSSAFSLQNRIWISGYFTSISSANESAKPISPKLSITGTVKSIKIVRSRENVSKFPRGKSRKISQFPVFSPNGIYSRIASSDRIDIICGVYRNSQEMRTSV